MNLSFPAGFGCTASIMTIVLSFGNILRYHVNASSRANRVAVMAAKWFKILLEVVMMGLWTTAFICMLLPKGKDFRFAFVKPPYGTWDGAAAVSCVQM